MARRKTDEIVVDHNHDGIDRRGFLKCMAWAGTGTLCVMKGGVLNSYGLSRFTAEDAAKAKGELSFAQISDSHMGFNKPANTDVVSTLNGGGQAQCPADTTGVSAAHGRYQSSLQAGRVRYGGPDPEIRGGERGFLCARGTRRDRR
jgi:hypothetical protein